MKLLKKFESYSQEREEMCQYLCRCGYAQEELDMCSEEELRQMCMSTDGTMDMSMKNENYGSREEMCNMLMKCGYEKEELDQMSKSEIEEICMSTDGTMAMSNEGMYHGTQNYMFFGNLQTMKRLIDKMLEMDESKVDAMLSNGHNWAVDHIATSKDDVEEVFNFLAGHNIDHGFTTHDNDMMSGDDSEEEVGCGCCDECNGQSDCECCDECTCNQSVINKDDGYPVNLAHSVIKSFKNFK